MVGGWAENKQDRSDLAEPDTIAAMDALRRRCGQCHQGSRALPLSAIHEIGAPPWEGFYPGDVRRRYARHLLYDLSRPEASLILLAPLAKAAGGYESCSRDVFATRADDDYRKVLVGIAEAGQKLAAIKRFDMPGFRPRRNTSARCDASASFPPTRRTTSCWTCTSWTSDIGARSGIGRCPAHLTRLPATSLLTAFQRLELRDGTIGPDVAGKVRGGHESSAKRRKRNVFNNTPPRPPRCQSE